MRLFNWKNRYFPSTPASRRLDDLAQMLEQVAVEIALERACLKDAYDHAIAQAAFAYEALEQGEDVDAMPSRVDALSAVLDRHSRRFHALKQQADFIDETRRRLELLASDEGLCPGAPHASVSHMVN